MSDKQVADYKFIGGFLDGESREYKGEPPVSVELWPETEGQRRKRLLTDEFSTSSDSQVYCLSEENGEPVFRVRRPLAVLGRRL
jgi:hypothetical protein